MISKLRILRQFVRYKHSKLILDHMVAPSNIALTVIDNGCDGTTKSVLLDTGTTRYLLNCGEGTQRILFEHKSKASRIHHTFITRMSWDHVSGLLGVALTARDAGIKTLNVHGPKNVEELMRLSRNFADCETTEIVSSDILSKPFVDSAFKVQAFPVTLTSNSVTVPPEPDPKRPKVDFSDANTIVFFFQPFQMRRKLDKGKCLLHGIPRLVLESSAIRDVVEGKGITLDDGKFIPSEFVTNPSYRTPNFLVIDCPNLEFIPKIEENQALWDALLTAPAEEKLKAGVSLIVHFLPRGMFSSMEYQNFVKRIADRITEHSDVTGIAESEVLHSDSLLHSLHHLVVDGSGCVPPLSGIYSQSTILNHYFDADVYPKLYNMKCEERMQAIKQAISSPMEPFSHVVYAQPQTLYSIRPWTGFKLLVSHPFDESVFIDSAFDPFYMKREEAEVQFAEMRAIIDKNFPIKSNCATSNCSDSSLDPDCPTTDSEGSNPYPIITFLGTGSSCPNKYRNISCILVQINSEAYIMLDCGEGSLNQLYALHGPNETHEILRRLRLVLVTHMHADHHGGLFSVALARSRLLTTTTKSLNSPLSVLAPPAFTRWMVRFQELFLNDPTISLFVVPHLFQSPPLFGTHPPIWPFKSDSPLKSKWTSLLNSLQLEVHPVQVPHTGSSWAYILRGTCPENGKKWSVVYSGDTPECPNLAVAGRNCDLLIHEATMIDEHEDLALKAKHSTIGTAVRIGEAMNASFTALNHFSQRYGRLPCTDTFRPNVFTAFDFMRIRLNNLNRLSYYVPYYKFAFFKHWEQQRTATESYHWRKFRETHGPNEQDRSGEEAPSPVKIQRVSTN